MGVGVTIQSSGPRLAGYVSRVPSAAGHGTPRTGLVLCPGFPVSAESAAGEDDSFPKLADRLAGESRWTVLTFAFRGTGRSEGDFSLGGWVADLRAAVDFLLEGGQGRAVWLGGVAAGGALGVCNAGGG